VGRRRKDGNHTPQENNSIEDSVGNEENGYPDPDLNKTMINVTKKPSDAYQKKKHSRRKYWNKSQRNLWRHA
jgi:hypothetical protein